MVKWQSLDKTINNLYKLRNCLTFTSFAVLNFIIIFKDSNINKSWINCLFLVTFRLLLWNALVLFTFGRVYP